MYIYIYIYICCIYVYSGTVGIYAPEWNSRSSAKSNGARIRKAGLTIDGPKRAPVTERMGHYKGYCKGYHKGY